MNEDKLTRIESSISGAFTFVWSADIVAMVKEIRRLQSALEKSNAALQEQVAQEKARRMSKLDKMAVRS